MAHLPVQNTHEWADLVVGGSYGNPVLLKLVENNLLTNGDFEDVLSGWTGTNSRVDAGSNAMKGNYVLSIDAAQYAHNYISRGTKTKILLTGFVRIATKVASKEFTIKLYPSDATARDAAPTTYLKIDINANDAGITALKWIPFYAMADLSITNWNKTYIHFEFQAESGLTDGVYVDDVKIYEVSEIVTMENPNVMKLNWQRVSDASYELADGTAKDYLKGWRAIYTLGYEYCSCAQLIKDIGLSESLFNFLIPHGNNISGDYVRMMNDFDSSYFHDRFIGHAQELNLPAIFLRKFKNTEYEDSYFTVSSAAA
jgi:hypothetical protein